MGVFIQAVWQQPSGPLLTIQSRARSSCAKMTRTYPWSAVHVAHPFLVLVLFSILTCVNVDFYVYGNPGAVFTHISVTNGNGVVDLIGEGTAKVYVGQTPKMNLIS